MAELTQKPNGIYIITSGDVTTNGIAGTFMLRKVRWVGNSTIGDSCVLCDAAGNTFFESKAAGTYGVDESRWSPPQRLNGLSVKVLSSGNVYLYVQ